MPFSLKSLVLQGVSVVLVAASREKSNPLLASFSSQNTCLLPPTYKAGNFIQFFIDTQVPSNPALNSSLSRAHKKPFISFDQEFTALIGAARPKLIAKNPQAPFFEAGVWDPVRNDVWFTASHAYFPEEAKYPVHILNLDTKQIRIPKFSQPILEPTGGYYRAGKIYLTTWGNDSYASGIVSIDPTTYKVETIVNTYFGLRFNGPDDITWTTQQNKKAYMLFTDAAYAYVRGILSGTPQLTPMAWRFDETAQTLTPLISNSEIRNPNGIRVSADQKKLYVTDTMLATGPLGTTPANLTIGEPAVYLFDLTADARAVNKRIFSYARSTVPDGIHIDDKGRVWTGEGEGIVVRSSEGRVLGIFNRNFFEVPKANPIANFALAGDKVVIGGNQELWTVQLTETVASRNRCVTVGC